MKNLALGFLFIIGFSLNCFSQGKTAKPADYQEGIEKKISVSRLAGNYVLKYADTSQDRTWVEADSVGLDFFPDTYLYGTGNIFFNKKTEKAALSASPKAAKSPSIKFGEYTFELNGGSLTIIYNSAANHGKFTVIDLKKSWLILEDVRTKKRWAFYKKLMTKQKSSRWKKNLGSGI